MPLFSFLSFANGFYIIFRESLLNAKYTKVTKGRIFRAAFPFVHVVPFVFKLFPWKRESALIAIIVTMNWYKTTLEISTPGKGLYDVTEQVGAQLRSWSVREGMCFLFMPHTSAWAVIQETGQGA